METFLTWYIVFGAIIAFMRFPKTDETFRQYVDNAEHAIRPSKMPSNAIAMSLIGRSISALFVWPIILIMVIMIGAHNNWGQENEN